MTSPGPVFSILYSYVHLPLHAQDDKALADANLYKASTYMYNIVFSTSFV